MNAHQHQIQYYPPPNHVGVLLPPLPNNPPVNGDLACAKDYVDSLDWTRKNNPVGLRATDEEVGQAIAYKAGLSFATGGVPPAAPAWVQGLFGYLDNKFDAIDNRFHAIDNRFHAIDNRFHAIDNRLHAIDNSIGSIQGEFTILLANGHAALDAPLYDPTRPGQWVFLAAPNPTSRDNLMTFDYMQCIDSAAALGLPPLPVNADLPTRKRQIAGRLGITMGLMG